jgi:hypothetical protein
VPFPPIEKNEIYVIAKLDKPLASLPGNLGADAAGRCAMGRWAKVSLDQGWVGGNLAGLGHLDLDWVNNLDLKSAADRGQQWLGHIKSLI